MFPWYKVSELVCSVCTIPCVIHCVFGFVYYPIVFERYVDSNNFETTLPHLVTATGLILAVLCQSWNRYNIYFKH